MSARLLAIKKGIAIIRFSKWNIPQQFVGGIVTSSISINSNNSWHWFASAPGPISSTIVAQRPAENVENVEGKGNPALLCVDSRLGSDRFPSFIVNNNNKSGLWS